MSEEVLEDLKFYHFESLNQIGKYQLDVERYQHNVYEESFRNLNRVTKSLENSVNAKLSSSFSILSAKVAASSKRSHQSMNESESMSKKLFEEETRTKKKIEINHGDNHYGLIESRIAVKFQNEMIILILSSDLIKVEKNYFYGIFKRNNFDDSLFLPSYKFGEDFIDKIPMKPKYKILEVEGSLEDGELLMMKKKFNNLKEELIPIIDGVHKTCIYERDTTSNYWGDPNLRNRMTGTCHQLEKAKKLLKE
eukprot:gene1480-12098_t